MRCSPPHCASQPGSLQPKNSQTCNAPRALGVEWGGDRRAFGGQAVKAAFPIRPQASRVVKEWRSLVRLRLATRST